MKTGFSLIVLVALMSSPTVAAVDPAKRNEAFAPKPVALEKLEKPLVYAGPSQPAAGSQQEFITVPVTDARIRPPQNRPKEVAPIEIAARQQPFSETAAARISTAQPAPAKFGRTFAKPTVARIQEGMPGAGRVKSTTAKARAKGNIIERINRFVFRRNPAAPERAAEPAGGANPPVKGAPADTGSADS